jgi:hypothetical protein
MERFYKNGFFKNDEVKTFVGMEIEHTTAYGKKTLFLATNEMTTEEIEIMAVQNNCEAIYYGANRKYMHNHGLQLSQIMKLLQKGFYVTVDYPFSLHEQVKEKFKSVWKNEKFIPFCSIIFPNSEDDDQLCIKIDDVDFNKTNPGVWSMSMNHLKQTAGFTSWNEYKKDEPVKQTKPSKEEEEDSWTLKTNTVKH